MGAHLTKKETRLNALLDASIWIAYTKCSWQSCSYYDWRFAQQPPPPPHARFQLPVNIEMCCNVAHASILFILFIYFGCLSCQKDSAYTNFTWISQTIFLFKKLYWNWWRLCKGTAHTHTHTQIHATHMNANQVNWEENSHVVCTRVPVSFTDFFHSDNNICICKCILNTHSHIMCNNTFSARYHLRVWYYL